MTPTPRRRAAALAFTAAALLLGTLGTGLRAEAKVTRPKITNVWARTSPSMATAGAVYMNITSPVADRLLRASVSKTVAAKTEIHETVPATSTTAMGGSMGGMGTPSTGHTQTTMAMAMTMRPVASVALPAGKKVELKPGGYHVMLLDLVKPLQTGKSFTLTLRFQKAGSVSFKVPVKPTATSPAAHSM